MESDNLIRTDHRLCCASFRTQAGLHEARIFSEHTLEAKDIVERERFAAGLQHGSPPAFEPLARRAFTLDFKVRPAVGEHEEACVARHRVRANATDRRPGLLREVEFDALRERGRGPDEGAEAAGLPITYA